MWRNAFFAAVLGLLVACAQIQVPLPGGSDGGQGGASSSSGQPGGTSGAAGTSVGTGGTSAAPCDEAGVCGDFVSGCTGCAVTTTCAEVYDGCFGDDACLDYNMCLTSCAVADAACRDGCAAANPVGADRYGALLSCIVCQVCPNSCANFAEFCP